VLGERRPVHGVVACPAMPRRVPTPTMTHASDMTDEHALRSEPMPVAAVRRRQRDPPATAVLDELPDANHAASVDPTNDEQPPAEAGGRVPKR
jgi:hypothetical protein